MGSLDTLRRLRRASLDDAQRALARCLQAEAQARTAVDALDRSVAQETAAAGVAGDDSTVEAFGAWLTQARRRGASLLTALEGWQAETHRSRAALTACRSALDIVEELARDRAAAVAAGRARVEQHAIDDALCRSTDATCDSGSGQASTVKA